MKSTYYEEYILSRDILLRVNNNNKYLYSAFFK